jgi:hypothetical protein
MIMQRRHRSRNRNDLSFTRPPTVQSISRMRHQHFDCTTHLGLKALHLLSQPLVLLLKIVRRDLILIRL